jgi:hypothetical protein
MVSCHRRYHYYVCLYKYTHIHLKRVMWFEIKFCGCTHDNGKVRV